LKENKNLRVRADKILILSLISMLTIAFDMNVVLAPSSDTLVAKYGSTPTIDGFIEASEWCDACAVTFSVTEGANCTVYAKQDGFNLYVGFNIPDATCNYSDSCAILLDMDHDKNISLQMDDIWLAISRKGSQGEKNVTFGGWYPTSVSGWTAKASSTASGWQSEYNITHSKLDITAGTDKTLGVDFLVIDNDVEKGWYTWPSRWISQPATWGDMIVDTTPPTLSIACPENKTYSVTDVPLTFTLSESTSWIGYSLDGQMNETINGNTTLVSLSEGVHTIAVYANDTAGNMGASGTVYFTVDTMPPSIEILSPENRTYTTSSVSLDFTVDEATPWICYSLDGQANVTITGNTVLIDLSDGAHCVQVCVNDTAGNTGSDTVCFNVDATPPEASFSYSPETPIVNKTLFFNASASHDPEGMVVSFEWDFGDGTTGTEVTTYHTYTEPGNYSVVLTIKDKAGNTDTKTIAIIVQEQPSIFSTWIIATILIIAGVGTAFLVYFRGKKTTIKIKR